MGELLLKFAVFDAPLFLGMMGAYVTISTPPKEAHHKWFAAFGVVATIAVGASILDSTLASKHLEDSISGRNEYFYLKAELSSYDAEKKTIQMRGITSGSNGVAAAIWITPAEIKGDANNPRYWTDNPLGHLARLEVPAGAYLTGINLPLGVWRIECTGKNTGWVEYLNIFELRGKVFQVITVNKDGAIVHDEVDPIEPLESK
jgi:hypothetical protein